MSESSKKTVMGKVTSVYGIKGWVKVFSYTQPKENLCQYREWYLADASGNQRSVKVNDCKVHGNGLIAHFENVNDRDFAKGYCGMLVSVPSQQLPELPEGDYYWSQLQGLHVFSRVNNESVLLGEVSHLLETGANDVLVVKKCKGSLDGKERLIPYLPEKVVKVVDLEKNLIEVDWDPDF